MHKSLIQMMRFIPLRVMYGFVAFFVLPACLVFNRGPVKAISQYFRGRYNLQGTRLALAVWKNHYSMMQMVIDRFAAYAGKKFEFEFEGNEAFKELESQPKGFIMLSSHIGNSEMVGYSLGSTIKSMSTLAYAGESLAVMENRRRLLAQHNIKLIPVDETFNHIFLLNEALVKGEIVGMPADRIIGSQKVFSTKFLNAEANFPLGPFATTIQRDVDSIAIFMMKQSAKRYKLIVRNISLSDEEKSKLSRKEMMSTLGRKYVTELENIVIQYPYQWFNYFDFWNEL